MKSSSRGSRSASNIWCMRSRRQGRSLRNAKRTGSRRRRGERDVLQPLVFTAAVVATGDWLAIVVIIAQAFRAVQLDALRDRPAANLASAVGMAACGAHAVRNCDHDSRPGAAEGRA